MITILLLILAVGVAVLAVFVAVQPSTFRITRVATLSAPAATVFEQVNDLHKWQTWSPWARIEPEARLTFDGPPAGVGASYAWVGKKNGVGRMTIFESHPSELIKFKLDFEKPFVAHNISEFTFKSEGSQTVVTWSMTGQNNFISKAFGLIINCDKLVGSQFESGLQNLKAVTETPTPA